ncbi:MAG: DUF1592 domain-containing protein [Planctomycetales bacterium]|nr:DUF1592 domain-containing protein [Planctomycetales bacterium]
MKFAWLSIVTLLIATSPFNVVCASEKLVAAFENRCTKCHGKDGNAEGDIDLSSVASAAALTEQPALIEDLISVLRDHVMPPEDEPPLPDETRERMVAELHSILQTALKSLPFEPIPIRRMNRFQYNNAVVDLLELDRDIFQMNERLLRRRENYFKPEKKKMPDQVRVSCRPLSKDIDNQRPEGFRGVAAFPQDKRAEHGFDNRADHLSLSPLLMESFLQLSQTISESPDLNERECGCWSWLISDPEKETQRSDAIRARLKRLLRRAFRRPVDEDTLNRFSDFTEAQLSAGASFEQSMRKTVSAVLAMPEFLYLHEDREAADSSVESNLGRYPISDFELATRLSQFFWSSIPDDALLDLAEQDRLHKPEILSNQIDRMMNDRRSSRFCDNFPAQWLQLERLVTAIPDPEKFSHFYYQGYRTSMHMVSEPLLLFETIFVEDRSVIELIDPKFTWQSKMLEANYEGSSNAGTEVQVQTFRRVSLNDPRRGGVITNAAVMTMTSTPTRTQPITRGAWINTVIFNDPPEPPPADVPPLPEVDAAALEKLTIRERLAVHRQRSDCAGCHNKIDQLGFALENYGPTGVWRDKYDNGRDVDVSGQLFNQYEFKTAVEFKQLIVQQKQRFIRAFASHLLSYALGREVGPADSPALDEITNKAMAGTDSMRSVLKHIAMSEPFLHKNIQPESSPGNGGENEE